MAIVDIASRDQVHIQPGFAFAICDSEGCYRIEIDSRRRHLSGADRYAMGVSIARSGEVLAAVGHFYQSGDMTDPLSSRSNNIEVATVDIAGGVGRWIRSYVMPAWSPYPLPMSPHRAALETYIEGFVRHREHAAREGGKDVQETV